MTFQQVYAVDGGEVSGVVLRRMYQSATRGGSGVIEPGDLRVRALDVPGPQVRISDGACGIPGHESSWQGSYYALNIGDHHLDIPPTGSASGRSDLVVVRVEDPTLPGSPWTGDPATEPLVRPHLITDVGAGATTIPASYGWSALPLARIDLPPSTATVTQDLITDVRQMLDPRSHMEIRVQHGVSPMDYAGNITQPDWENWPNLPWPDVPIPHWATQVQVDAIWGNCGYFPSDVVGGSGSTDARGVSRIALVAGGVDITTDKAVYNFNLDDHNGQRVNMICADQVPIPAAARGRTGRLRMQISGEPKVRGRLRASRSSNFRVLLHFLEVPVMDVDS